MLLNSDFFEVGFSGKIKEQSGDALSLANCDLFVGVAVMSVITGTFKKSYLNGSHNKNNLS